MIYKKEGLEVDQAYMREGYRRLYWYAVDKNLQKIEYDRIIIESEVYDKKFSYTDYYCPSKLQTRLLEELVNEEYTTKTGRIHIPNYTKNTVRQSCTLGCSPFSCLSTFLSKRKETETKIKRFLTEKDIEELDEY